MTRYTTCLDTITNYLWKHKHEKRIDEVTPKDVKDFESWGAKKLKSFNQYIWALKVYSEYTANYEIEMFANELLGFGTRLDSVTDLRFARPVGFDILIPELNRLVAVRLDGLDLHHSAGPRKENCNRVQHAVSVIHLRHTYFFA